MGLKQLRAHEVTHWTFSALADICRRLEIQWRLNGETHTEFLDTNQEEFVPSDAHEKDTVSGDARRRYAPSVEKIDAAEAKGYSVSSENGDAEGGMGRASCGAEVQCTTGWGKLGSDGPMSANSWSGVQNSTGDRERREKQKAVNLQISDSARRKRENKDAVSVSASDSATVLHASTVDRDGSARQPYEEAIFSEAGRSHLKKKGAGKHFSVHLTRRQFLTLVRYALVANSRIRRKHVKDFVMVCQIREHHRCVASVTAFSFGND